MLVLNMSATKASRLGRSYDSDRRSFEAVAEQVIEDQVVDGQERILARVGVAADEIRRCRVEGDEIAVGAEVHEVATAAVAVAIGRCAAQPVDAAGGAAVEPGLRRDTDDRTRALHDDVGAIA